MNVFAVLECINCFPKLMSSSSWSTSNFKHLCLKNQDEIRGSKCCILVHLVRLPVRSLFLLVGESNFVRTEMGTGSEVFLANFYLFSYEFDVLGHLTKSHSCAVFLHNFILSKKFWLMIFWAQHHLQNLE
jgi:hypothetical protein